MYISQLPEPVETLQLVGVKLAPRRVDIGGLLLALNTRIALEASVGLPSSDAPVLLVVQLLELLVLLHCLLKT